MCEKEFSFMTRVIFLSCLVWHVPCKLSRCCERCCLCAHCKGSDFRLLACWTLLPKTVPEVSVWEVLRILCKICNTFTYLFSLLVQSETLRWREAVSLPLLNVSGLSGLTVVFCYSPFDTENLFLSPGTTTKFSVSSRKSSLYNWTPPNTPSFREKYYLVSMLGKAQS